MPKVISHIITTGVGDCSSTVQSLHEFYKRDDIDIYVFSDNGLVYIYSKEKFYTEELDQYPLRMDKAELLREIHVELNSVDENIINVCTYLCDQLFGLEEKIAVIHIKNLADLTYTIVLPTMFKYSKYAALDTVKVGNAADGADDDVLSVLKSKVKLVAGGVR